MNPFAEKGKPLHAGTATEPRAPRLDKFAAILGLRRGLAVDWADLSSADVAPAESRIASQLFFTASAFISPEKRDATRRRPARAPTPRKLVQRNWSQFGTLVDGAVSAPEPQRFGLACWQTQCSRCRLGDNGQAGCTTKSQTPDGSLFWHRSYRIGRHLGEFDAHKFLVAVAPGVIKISLLPTRSFVSFALLVGLIGLAGYLQ